MLKLIQVLKGYVRIKVWGHSPERFLNLCCNRNILLWDIQKKEDVYTMCISLKAFYQLKPIARKTGTRVVIIQRVGLPFFVPVMMGRKIFCLGLIGAIAFWILSSFFVWDIEWNGNYQLTEDMLVTFLKEQQVSIGMKKRNLDIEVLEKALRKEFDVITWTSARLDGTRLIIDIKENDVATVPVSREDIAQDLVSEFEGTVVAMIVRSGVPMVAIGDTVTEDMVLVEGRIPIYAEDGTVKEYQYVAADADILIEHSMTHIETLPADYMEKEYTGREKKRYFIRVGDWEWKMTEEQPFLVYDRIIREKRPVLFEKLSVPVFWGTITYREYLNVEYQYALLQAKEELSAKMLQFFKNLEEKGVHIIEKNVRIDTDGVQWSMQADLTVQELAAKKLDIMIEDNLTKAESDQTETN